MRHRNGLESSGIYSVTTLMCECVWMWSGYCNHFWRTSLMHCQQSMMGFISLLPHLQLNSCCGRRRSHRRSPSTPLPLFITQATPLPSRLGALPPPTQREWLVAVCLHVCSLVYDYRVAPSHITRPFLPTHRPIER
jgi:hypothetical protein